MQGDIEALQLGLFVDPQADHRIDHLEDEVAHDRRVNPGERAALSCAATCPASGAAGGVALGWGSRRPAHHRHPTLAGILAGIERLAPGKQRGGE